MSGAWTYPQTCAPNISERHGVLTPAGDNSLNIASGAALNRRKRKRGGGDERGDVREPFILRVRNPLQFLC